MEHRQGSQTRRNIESFFEELGEHTVRQALQNRMRFPMPFGEYHAAMWLARLDRERRELARSREALRLARTLDAASAASDLALERGARFAAGAALVALIAIAFGGLKG